MVSQKVDRFAFGHSRGDKAPANNRTGASPNDQAD
jgi:hypothetical protein